MSLFDEVVILSDDAIINQRDEEARKINEFNIKVSNEVRVRRHALISSASIKIKKAAGEGKKECIFVIGQGNWEVDRANMTVLKALGVILIDWLSNEGFVDIENVSISEKKALGSRDTIQIKIGW
jgi:hypothetical protein